MFIRRAISGISRPMSTSQSRSVSSKTEVLDPIQEALLEEQCILVDEHDKPLGQASKRECHLIDEHGSSPLHRAFSLFIFNSKNELLLQQRSDEKVTFPGLWTNTCCSHPLAKEDEKDPKDAMGVKRAAQRRIFNELGVPKEQCPVEEMRYVTRILYSASSTQKWGEHELDYILFLRRDVDMKPNPNEVKDTIAIRREELYDFLNSLKEQNVGITPWFSLIAESMLPIWWKDLDNIEKHVDHVNIKRFY